MSRNMAAVAACHVVNISISFLGGGFKYVLFSPLFGEDFQFDYFFQMG